MFKKICCAFGETPVVPPPNYVHGVAVGFFPFNTSKRVSILIVHPNDFWSLDDSLSEKKCYCCGREAETQKCSKCLLVRYCSKECQKLDWAEFNHKDVCKHLKKYSNKL